MASFIKEFEHLEIQPEDIKSATNNFDESKVIGAGGFGKVYAGELSHAQSEEKSVVAIKRLDRRYGQGNPEFFKEVRMLSCYRHENLISLLGFCCQGGEMILIYEYAARGSLDPYLSSADLTWTQRLRICIDAAKGLSFLHDPNGTQQRVLHCDIKCSNILLDKNMTAKVSDFGLSKMGPANQQYSLLITSAVGTLGYCDPLYMETYSLTKESDVYSFGLVLFEVLCGRLCVEISNGQLKVLVPVWKKSYEENKLDEIILQDLRQQMDPSSLKTFSDIAFQCLRKAREERPTMSRVVEELEIALESQEFPDHRLALLSKCENLLMAVDPLLIYRTGNKIIELLSEGLITNEGKTRLTINEKGEHIERIYIEACVNLAMIESNSLTRPRDINSRLRLGIYIYSSKFEAHVRGQYLTPQISYTLKLIFRYYAEPDVYPLRYKLDGEAKVLIIYPIYMREDGWVFAPLYEFTSQHTTADLQFEFEYRGETLLVGAFEFQPSEEKVDLQVTQEYQDIVKAASHLFYRSLDQLKQILSIGVHLNGYKTWLSLNKKGQRCHMISMEDCLIPKEQFPSKHHYSAYVSRFPAGFYETNNKGFKTHVKTHFLSPSITYTVNLAFYSPSTRHQSYVNLKYRLRGETSTSIVYFANHRKDLCLYTAELYQFTSDGSIVDLEIDFDKHIYGVEGILFQPLEIVEDQVSKDDNAESIQTISDSDSESDTYWEKKFPNDYEEILNFSKDSLMWTTKKELYSILRRGFLIDDGQKVFAIDKHGKKCVMLSARATLIINDKNSTWKSLPESRFGEVLIITAGNRFEIQGEIESKVVSPETTYGVYLVYKLPKDQSAFKVPLFINNYKFAFLVCPPATPVIGQKLDENTYNTVNRPNKLYNIPQQRSDGWMEVKVWKLRTKTSVETISMGRLGLQHPGLEELTGLMVHCTRHSD